MYMRSLWLDIRYALRSLGKAPIFTTVAVLSLALGIGANTAIFSLLDQLLLRPLPVRDPAAIVQLAARGNHYGSNWGMDCMSFPMYRDFRDKLNVFDGLIARRTISGILGYGGQVQPVSIEIVTGNYFQMLGVGPARGRVLMPDDDKTLNGHPVVVLGYDFWKTKFAGQESIIGQNIVIANQNFNVIGVAQEAYTGMQIGSQTQIYAPMAMQEVLIQGQKGLLENRRTRFVNVFGRMKPGITIERVRAEIEPMFKQIILSETKEKDFAKASKEDIDAFLRSRMTVFPGGSGTSYMRRSYGPALWVLMSLVGVVLLIACANVANLQLARATARQKEIAVRLSVGASRWQITRQLLVESLMLAFAAGILGLIIGQVGSSILLAMQPQGDTPSNLTASLDPRILLFTFGVSLLTGVLFGVAPAFQTTNPDMASTLKEQAGAVVGGTHARFRKGLVLLQVTLSLLLLIGAGLFARSLHNLQTLDPGFRTTNILMFNVDAGEATYTLERSHTFYRALWDSISTLPGVEAVSSANMPVVSGNEWDSSITVEGQDPGKSSNRWAYMNHVTPNYFQTLGAPMLAGREFNWSDTNTSKKVAIVNEQFVKEYCGGRDPIGMHIGMGSDPGTKTDIQIVGVVRNFKYENMQENIGRQLYRPLQQMPFVLGQYYYVRTSGDPQTMFQAMRSEVRKLDANLPVTSMRTIAQQVERNLTTQRLVAGLSVCFGLLATLLAVLGLYGVMAYLVSRRSREIGIRIALGADTGSVVGMILKEVALLVGIGLVAGLAASIGLTGFVKSQLYGVVPNDPIVLAIATAVLAMVALFAGWLPANKASRTDPLSVLRYE
jgi:predicted permease